MWGAHEVKVSANYLASQFDEATTQKILDDIRALVATGDFTLGKPMLEFERAFAKEFRTHPIVAVNSGTEALSLALKAAGIGPEDRVITVPNTFYATVGAIVAVGAVPIFCDVDASHQMDPEALRKYRRASAVLPVWWGGLPPDLPAIRGVATDNNWRVVEDACQAVGASLNGVPSGLWGEAAAWSFHPMKPLHVWGDGGAVSCPGRLDWLRLYRDHGKVNRDQIAMWGVNARMHTLQCVVALQQLPLVKRAVAERQRIADILDHELDLIDGITVPPRRGRPSWRTYFIEAERRDELKAALIADGIDVAVHYPTPLHLQAPGRALGYGPGDFPNAERQATRMLTLPCHEYLRPDEVEYMIDRVRKFYA